MARMEIAARFQYANECRLAVKGSGAFFSLFFSPVAAATLCPREAYDCECERQAKCVAFSTDTQLIIHSD